MEKWWFNSMLFNRGLEYRCGLSKSIDSFGPIENNSVNEDPSILTDMDNNIQNWKNNSENSSYSHGDYNDDNDIDSYILDDNDKYIDSYIESYLHSQICIDSYILDDNDKYIDSYILDDNDIDSYILDDNDKYIDSYIESYLHSQICIDSYILDDSDKYNDSDFNSYICGKVKNSSESKSTSIITITNDSDLTKRESSNDLDETQKYKHLWIQCENCYGLNYKKISKSKLNICEHCGSHLKMSSSDRIELLIDPGTWNAMDENMVSVDPIEFHSEEEPYKNRLDSYQKSTGLQEAIQTGTGQLNGIPVAIGIMDFQFMGGSMGSVVGEKITRLIEYATNQLLPLIIVCASGGARMQEGSLSLMQMAKISSALYNYQINQKLFYVPILTSPTTGGVTASFGMLGDIIIAEPNAYIAFAGKRVIEQTLNKEVPEGSQSAEFLFQKGLFDLIVPRNPLKEVLTELFQFHGFFPLTQNEK